MMSKRTYFAGALVMLAVLAALAAMTWADLGGAREPVAAVVPTPTVSPGDESASTSAGSAAGTVPPASVTSTTAPAPMAPDSSGFFVRATLVSTQLDPAYQSGAADVIVWGTVVEVSPARWNSEDGREWRSTSEADMPIVYTTFLVEPKEILKGDPAWGTPVAIRTLGGYFGDGAQLMTSMGEFADVSVGDEIIVMGVDHPFYGGVYDRPAYWSLVNATSIYRGNEKAGFRRLNAPDESTSSLDVVSLQEARSLARAERQ